MRSLALIAAALAVTVSVASAGAGPRRLAGQVEAARSRDAGDVIVTESQVRLDDGSLATVVQLGGVVDGVGMWFSDHPAPLAAGDRVDGLVAGDGDVVQLVATIAPATVIAGPASADGDDALYGVVRTSGSERPVWHASACRHVAYGPSVTADREPMLDAAFDAWTEATRGCGGPAVLHGGVVADAAGDGIDSLHIRAERWCRPATASEPELCHNPDATGVTRLRFVDNAFDPDDGRILDADIELNATNFTLAEVRPDQPPPPPPPPLPVIDLQSVATHELGHLLGLSHSCATGTEPVPRDHSGTAVPPCDGLAAGAQAAASTMFFRLGPGETQQRTLEAGDRAAACALVHGATCETSVTGGLGCRASRPPGAGAALGVGLLALLRRRRRSGTERASSAAS